MIRMQKKELKVFEGREASYSLVVPLRNPSIVAKSVPSPNVSHTVARSGGKVKVEAAVRIASCRCSIGKGRGK